MVPQMSMLMEKFSVKFNDLVSFPITKNANTILRYRLMAVGSD